MHNTSGDDSDDSSLMDYGPFEAYLKPGFPEVCVCGAKMILPDCHGRRLFICEKSNDPENREMHYIKWWDNCAAEEIEEIKKKLEVYQVKHAYTHQDRISKLEEEVAALKEEVASWMKGFIQKVDEIEETEILSSILLNFFKSGKMKDICCDSVDYKGKTKSGGNH